LPAIIQMTSPRAWAFALMGIHEYFRRLTGDRLVSQIRDTLVSRLVELYEKQSSSDFPWFEPVLSYANAKIPEALIAIGHACGNAKARDLGLRSLRWLLEQQKAPQGHFRPIGSNGFHVKGQNKAQFDQQPIEAWATLSAALEAYRISDDNFWLREAWNAFEWFLGRNDLGEEIYDPQSGGCCDGLHEDRVNQNQGAESTLAFLLSLAELNLLEHSLSPFRLDDEIPADSPSETTSYGH